MLESQTSNGGLKCRNAKRRNALSDAQPNAKSFTLCSIAQTRNARTKIQIVECNILNMHRCSTAKCSNPQMLKCEIPYASMPNAQLSSNAQMWNGIDKCSNGDWYCQMLKLPKAKGQRPNAKHQNTKAKAKWKLVKYQMLKSINAQFGKYPMLKCTTAHMIPRYIRGMWWGAHQRKIVPVRGLWPGKRPSHHHANEQTNKQTSTNCLFDTPFQQQTQ